MPRIALVSMPWRRPNNAAIGLASLKAVALENGAVACDVHYLSNEWFRLLHHRLGNYPELDGTSFSEFSRIVSELAGVIQAGEWVFSHKLFGPSIADKEQFRRSFGLATRGNTFARFHELVIDAADLVDSFTADCIATVDWDQYDVIGLSCVFYQLSPSLLFAQRIRERGFKGTIAFGGPLVEGVVGKQLLALFPFIDCVFDGEAEKSFGLFVRHIAGELPQQSVVGTWFRSAYGPAIQYRGDASVGNMDALPVPDYTDFFALLARKDGVKVADVAFPLEGSRGCWWGERHHCIFCGLNGADMTHRMKTAERIYSEILTLHREHGVSHFAFTDNIVSPKFIRPLMEMLEENRLPITFHAEIKSNLSRRQLKDYRSAGFVYLQPGIESISSNVLRIMDKGVSALANIACLKYCREVGIRPFWNLLYGFPRESDDDYRQILKYLPFLVHLDPPEVVTPMRLTRFSPSFTRSAELGFHNPRPASFYHLIFPFPDDQLRDLVNSFEFDFHDDVQRDAFALELAEFVGDWKDQQTPGLLVYDPFGEPGAGGVIYDSRYTRKIDTRVLSALEDRVFRGCDRPLSVAQIAAELNDPLVSEEAVRDVLTSLEADMLALSEGDVYLNLALSESSFIPWQAMGVLEQLGHATSSEREVSREHALAL